MAHPLLLGLLASTLCLLPTGKKLGPRFADRCLKARQGAGTVRILHFGDSHLAGTAGGEYRQRFQSQWGDGGPGLVLPWLQPRTGVRATASGGWTRRRLVQGGSPAGLSQGSLTADQAGAWAALEAPFTRFRCHLLKGPNRGKVALSVDGVPQGELDLNGPAGQLALFQRDLPVRPGVHRLELRSLGGGPVTILGVALEGAAGAVYSPIAFNGARASWLKDVPEDLFRAEVTAEAPDLIILAFGTNEALDRGLDAAGYRKGLEAILGRFRAAAPQAAIALVGPPDLASRKGSAESLETVIAVQKAVAEGYGCLFMDQRQSMGGAGAMLAWFREGLANRDLVHLSPPGYQRLSQFVTQSILTDTAQSSLLDAGAVRRRPGRADGPPAQAPSVHPIYVYRGREGRVMFSDNPNMAQESDGEWVMDAPH